MGKGIFGRLLVVLEFSSTNHYIVLLNRTRLNICTSNSACALFKVRGTSVKDPLTGAYVSLVNWTVVN